MCDFQGRTGFQTLPCRWYVRHIRPPCSLKHQAPLSLNFCLCRYSLHLVQWTNYSSSLRTQLRQTLFFIRGSPSPLTSGKMNRTLGAPSLSYIPSQSHRLIILYGQSLLLLLSVICTPVAWALPGSLQECRITHGIRICLETRPSPTRVVHTQLQI